MNPKEFSKPQYLLAVLRIYLGVILLITDIGKLTASIPFSEVIVRFLKGWATFQSPFYRNFAESIVLPNVNLFSYLVMTGEMVAGIGLLIGACTRLSAGVAMLLFVNFMFAKGAWFWSPNSQDAAVFFIALVVFIGRSGRVWGVDSLLKNLTPLSRFFPH